MSTVGFFCIMVGETTIEGSDKMFELEHFFREETKGEKERR